MVGAISNACLVPSDGPCGSIPEARLQAFRHRNAPRRRKHRGLSVPLRSSLTHAWQEWRSTTSVFSSIVHACSRKQSKGHSPIVVDEIAGQYEDNFDDVDKVSLNFLKISIRLGLYYACFSLISFPPSLNV
eukprot:Gb_25793 [translate_table: standard]